jgi:hypothetical protein
LVITASNAQNIPTSNNAIMLAHKELNFMAKIVSPSVFFLIKYTHMETVFVKVDIIELEETVIPVLLELSMIIP